MCRSIPRALTTGKPVVIPNIEHDDQLHYPEACRKEGIKALLSIPVIFKEETIGVLRLYDGKVRAFSEDEVEFVTAPLLTAGTLGNPCPLEMQNPRHAEYN